MIPTISLVTSMTSNLRIKYDSHTDEEKMNTCKRFKFLFMRKLDRYHNQSHNI